MMVTKPEHLFFPLDLPVVIKAKEVEVLGEKRTLFFQQHTCVGVGKERCIVCKVNESINNEVPLRKAFAKINDGIKSWQRVGEGKS